MYVMAETHLHAHVPRKAWKILFTKAVEVRGPLSTENVRNNHILQFRLTADAVTEVGSLTAMRKIKPPITEVEQWT